MNVFIIGGSGYIGRSVTRQILAEGHSVTALARSEVSAARLPMGAVDVVRGTIEDLDAMQRGLATADAAIYLAVQGAQGASDADRGALRAITDSFRGTDKPFLVTSGIGVYAGTPATAVDETTSLEHAPSSEKRVALERDLFATGARVVVIRPSLVYGQGNASPILLGLLRHARERGEALVLGEGANMMPSVHIDDLASVFTLALTAAPAGTVLNVAAAAVMQRDLARAVSYAAGLGGEIVARSPNEILAALGPLGGALLMDLRLSNLSITRMLGWTPHGPSVLYELLHGSLGAIASPGSGA
jgi:nucleoside-diphosphate-sugar epimerase